MWSVVTEGGQQFSAFIDEKHFSLLRNVDDLDEFDVKDSKVLFQLLRWQNDMQMIRFQISDDNTLWLEYGRSFEDLDVSEVCKALLAMSEAVESYVPSLEKYLGA